MALSKRSLLIMLLVICADLVVVAGAILVLQRSHREPAREQVVATSPPASLVFPAFSYDAVRLEAEWESERNAMGAFQMGVPEEELIQAVRDVNRALARPGLSYEQASALADSLQVNVSGYIGVRGPDPFRELGWTLFEPFQDAVNTVIHQATAQGTDVQVILAGLGQESTNILENTGNFFDIATETGLIGRRGQELAPDSLLAVLFRYRWFSLAEDYANLSLMTPYERQVFWRWRIEAAQGFSLDERLAMVDRAEAIYRASGTDPDHVRGILAYQAGELDLAEQYLRRAVRNNPDDATLPPALQYLRTRRLEEP